VAPLASSQQKKSLEKSRLARILNHSNSVIGGEGAVDIFRMRDPNHYDHVGRTDTAAGARTGLFVSGLDRLFVAVPHRRSQAAKLLVYQIAR
jgi:hypothetical protein